MYLVLIAFRLQSEFGPGRTLSKMLQPSLISLNRLSASVRIWTSETIEKLVVRLEVLIAFRLQSEFGLKALRRVREELEAS